MIEDYYIDLYYVNTTQVSDGTGGYEKAYIIGESFKGSAVRSTMSEQQLAGIRGVIDEQYTITTYDNNIINANDIIMFVDIDKERVFLRVNSNITYTPEHSGQSRWKYTTATKFEPDLRVIDGTK